MLLKGQLKIQALECLSSLHEKYVIVPAGKASELQKILYLFVKPSTSFALIRNWALKVTSQVMPHTNILLCNKDGILNNHSTSKQNLRSFLFVLGPYLHKNPYKIKVCSWIFILLHEGDVNLSY